MRGFLCISTPLVQRLLAGFSASLLFLEAAVTFRIVVAVVHVATFVIRLVDAAVASTVVLVGYKHFVEKIFRFQHSLFDCGFPTFLRKFLAFKNLGRSDCAGVRVLL